MSDNGGTPLRSRTITGLPTARAMFRPLGFTRERLARPNVGVAHMWSETGPCNFGHRKLAGWVKEGIEAAGGTAFEFSTSSVNDGITMGTQGMKGSLISREVITDSIELMARSHMFDGLVVIVGCDKTIPAGAMALAGRLVRDKVLPRSILTREAFENAIVSFVSTGGSTNAVLHLLAIAHEAGVRLELEDFHRITVRSPIYADLKPGGRYVATDLYRAGGLAMLSKRLLEAGLVH